MKSDYKWIDEWSSKIEGKSVLELGAGSGIDTRRLKLYSSTLISGDLKPVNDTVIKIDHSQALAFESDQFDVVVASLTLHYFEWQKTEEIVEEIRRVLKSGGLLICRVNSELDVNYGAEGFPRVEPGLYQVSGQLKRFFSEADIHRLWTDPWTVFALAQKQIDRYEKSKYIWEFGAIST